jgi:hypothetical protein
MIKKIRWKNLLVSVGCIIFFFGAIGINHVLASVDTITEVQDGPCSNSSDLPTCAVNVFKWGIDIAGAIAGVSFAIGAVGLIASGDNPETASNAKDRMKGALLGLLLLGSSYIIMNSINPAIVKPSVTALSNPNVKPLDMPAGVYYYSDASCSQNNIGSTVTGSDSIGVNVKAIKIVDDAENSFGVILHKVEGLKNGGQCGQPITTATTCQSVNNMNGAIDVFQINKNPSSSGDGVEFYSRPYGLDRGARAGFYQVTSDSINSPSTTEDPGMTFKYDGVDVPDEYKKSCDTFKKCPGSIDIKGDYIVAIYSSGDSGSGSSSGSGSYCQTFTDNVENLDTEPVVASGTDNLTQIYIFPTGAGADTGSGGLQGGGGSFGGGGAGGSY